MVWGAFCAAMRAPLVFLNGRMTLTEMVQQVYWPGLLPFIAWMEQAPWIRGCHCLLLMEDNAPIHTARASTDWRNQHNIIKLDWPAHSPNLNTIKNVWKAMKSQISNEFPDLSSIGGEGLGTDQRASFASYLDIYLNRLKALFLPRSSFSAAFSRCQAPPVRRKPRTQTTMRMQNHSLTRRCFPY
ncbi:hypothetical protein O181_024948 [Austropuccinia psidii MF-1]|uniref:Tc1-like transposase DDE domain-containing protein n=1 Tax=Austropuccinia psidii MF-1 TaxID=1389203 RepID=A0A9Q3CLR4_9BASI|nr:hypothetical protein [Austropuccinia psidii MF-1]